MFRKYSKNSTSRLGAPPPCERWKCLMHVNLHLAELGIQLVARTTRNPRMKSWMNGLTPSVPRRAERQSDSNPSQAPPRITLTPMTFEAGPSGSVSNPPGYGPYQSRHHSRTFPAMSYRPHRLGAFCPTGCVVWPLLTAYQA